MKPLHRILVVIASGVLGLAAVAAALVYVNRPEPSSGASVPASPTTEISRETLAKHDGANGNPCYVAVDGTVYLIEGSPLWASGKHQPSGGRAECGRDLSQVIGQSPHGRKKLNLLKIVGKLQG